MNVENLPTVLLVLGAVGGLIYLVRGLVADFPAVLAEDAQRKRAEIEPADVGAEVEAPQAEQRRQRQTHDYDAGSWQRMKQQMIMQQQNRHRPMDFRRGGGR